LAFSTIQGSGGAPDSFVGTSGVDAIALANSTGNFFLGANQAADQIIVSNTGSALYSSVLSTATIKAGDGRDTVTLGTAGNVSTFTGLFLNGNGDRDTITFVAADSLLASTVKGGAANDTITTGISTSALINGNKGQDTITLGGNTTLSSARGGGGNDTITTATLFTRGLMAGDDGNDNLSVTGAVAINTSTFEGGDGNDIINLAAAGAAGDTGVSLSGGAGVDVLTGPANGTSATLDGGDGVDTLTLSGGTATLIGGAGSDTLAMGAAAATALYNSSADYGAGASAASAALVEAGDTITGFTTTVDVVAVGNIVTGVGARALDQAAAGAFLMNTNGVLVTSAGAVAGTYVQGTTTYAGLATIFTQGAATITGDAGDTGIIQILDNGGNILNIAVTLGTAAAARAINNTDTLALLGTQNAVGVAADFSFATA
jgi:Ca2+-binding RTX toxin-like protein